MPGSSSPPSLRRVLLAAAAAMTVGLGLISLFVGFSDYPVVRLLQGLAVFGAGAVLLGGTVVLAMVHLGGWRGAGGELQSEDEFEAIVQRAERLAAGDRDRADVDGGGRGRLAGSGDTDEYAVSSDQEFRALVRAAIDELPLEFHRALEHVAIVISDGGRRQRAYGLYQGDTIVNDYFHDRIVIFQDTLTRDFGHDPGLLKAQVTRTVRHELAHHLGWGEKGVRGLGL